MTGEGAGSAGEAGRPTVVLTDYPWPDCEVERGIVEAAGYALVTGKREAGSAADIEAVVSAADPVAILTCWAPVSGKAIAAPKDLRIVARMGVGLDNIDIAAATARGAFVTNVPDYCVEEVSDHALALMLAWLRGVPVLDREVKAGTWKPGGAKVVRVATLTVGLVGIGRIGRVTARKLAGFGCRVIAADPAAKDPPENVTLVPLATLQAEADVIILHLPLLPVTQHIVNDAFIAACARKPLLINVSRGGLVDNDALIRGLDGGKLSAAGLDVVEGEPNPPAALVSRPDVVVTPHVAFLSPTSLLELRRRSTEEVVRVLRGLPPQNPVNRPPRRGEELSGGVSSDIRIADTPLGRTVIKQALGKLKVEADWFSDPSRSLVEAAALETIGELLGPGTVPQVLWRDPESHAFGMALVPDRFRNWKAELMAGRVDLATAARVGGLLGVLHSRSAKRPDIAERFADTRFFEELRIRPYFRRIAERNPDLAPAIGAGIDGMASSAEKALVHGDFSPKNILADGGEAVILDCEVAHWGDPRFDVGFCLSHLLLKAMRQGADGGKLIAAARRYLDVYRAAGLPVLDQHLVRLTGMLILARLEGDSPVDYRDSLRPGIAKPVAVAMIGTPAADLEQSLRLVQEAIA